MQKIEALFRIVFLNLTCATSSEWTVEEFVRTCKASVEYFLSSETGQK